MSEEKENNENFEFPNIEEMIKSEAFSVMQKMLNKEVLKQMEQGFLRADSLFAAIIHLKQNGQGKIVGIVKGYPQLSAELTGELFIQPYTIKNLKEIPWGMDKNFKELILDLQDKEK